MNSQTLRWRPTWSTSTPRRCVAKSALEKDSVDPRDLSLPLLTGNLLSRLLTIRRRQQATSYKVVIYSKLPKFPFLWTTCRGGLVLLEPNLEPLTAKPRRNLKENIWEKWSVVSLLTSLSLELISGLSCQLSLEISIEINKYNNTKYMLLSNPSFISHLLAHCECYLFLTWSFLFIRELIQNFPNAGLVTSRAQTKEHLKDHQTKKKEIKKIWNISFADKQVTGIFKVDDTFHPKYQIFSLLEASFFSGIFTSRQFITDTEMLDVHWWKIGFLLLSFVCLSEEIGLESL